MTNDEYYKLMAEARRYFPRLTLDQYKKIKKIYQSATVDVSKAIAEAQLAGRSQLTIRSLQSIEEQLTIAAQKIREAIDKGVNASSTTGTKRITDTNTEYLSQAVKDAGAASKATIAQIQNMFVGINTDLIASIASRVYQDGYSFSQRLWAAGEYYQDKIKDILTHGLAQGRPVEAIAKDIQVYVKDGKVKLAQRYGPNFQPGDKTFLNRIGRRIDFRALRLVRAELYNSLQQLQAEQGRANPAAFDLYDWILEWGRQQWPCVCPDNAKGSPYRFNEIPEYPHPNCACQVRARLRKRSVFVDDLAKWASGTSVDYLDSWASQWL